MSRVERVDLSSGDIRLTGLFASPTTSPRATIVAVHGLGMTARYFDYRALAGQSFLEFASESGYNVVSVNRPGYGGSSSFSDGMSTIEMQADALASCVNSFLEHRDVGAGVIMMAHSFGCKVALSLSSRSLLRDLIGIELSSCGYRYEPGVRLDFSSHYRNWGPLRLYPPGTFLTLKDILATPPEQEIAEAARWTQIFPTLAKNIRVPIRLTFGEYEGWWRHDKDALLEIQELLDSSPMVAVEQHPDAGHNIGLGISAHEYHLKALNFFDTLS
ncbi:alpha/beta hydrolase [Rhodococcus sp. H29-C3]|nr:alpha/beta hydrolase [Rhodococcus sp. H29-C3]MDJ0362462.1 alpha/beta hydrolase [Rhodococcus sp. H29-C3]